MPCLDIVRNCEIIRTPRIIQIEGLFDLPAAKKSERRWHVEFEWPSDWSIGVIVGPSGSGKSTLARELFGDRVTTRWDWPEDRSILDGFPEECTITEIVDALTSVGLSSPPTWLRPYRFLSVGEQFRVDVARALLVNRDLTVIDEFTSVVDRTVAKVASAALAKTIRRQRRQFVAITCHYDILEWLEPDWLYDLGTGSFQAGRCLQRPKLELELRRCDTDIWPLFAPYHYLSGNILRHAKAFSLFLDGVHFPIGFVAWCYQPSKTRSGYREHRLVVLPDYQGIGIGSRLSDTVASIMAATGYPCRAVTSHPGLIRHRLRSPYWIVRAKGRLPSPFGTKERRRVSFKQIKGFINSRRRSQVRSTWSFEYVGPANYDAAKNFGII